MLGLFRYVRHNFEGSIRLLPLIPYQTFFILTYKKSTHMCLPALDVHSTPEVTLSGTTTRQVRRLRPLAGRL